MGKLVTSTQTKACYLRESGGSLKGKNDRSCSWSMRNLGRSRSKRCLNDGIVRFSCLVVSSEVLLLSQGLPVLGLNGRYLSSHQVQETILTRNNETRIDGFRYLLNKVIRGRD